MKHRPVRQHELFKIKEGGVERSRKYCPRCGDSFLAKHQNRYYCGKCKMTVFEEKM